MRAEGLEAEKKLVSAAEQRASTEATEASREKFRLAAELEAARKVHADRQQELVAEVARLKEEAQRAQRDLGDAQRELSLARSRAEGAVRASEAAQVDATAKLQKLDEEVGRWEWVCRVAGVGVGCSSVLHRVGWLASRARAQQAARDMPAGRPAPTLGMLYSPAPVSCPPIDPSHLQVRHLRDALSSAQQRATAAEARVELLQEAVRKAEERAARLEMAAASRAAAGEGVAGGSGGAGAGAADGSHEAELAAEVKLLREELAAAQVGWVGRLIGRG